jgi:catechol 2,3-dioxygenase-like lactoylglutathione lyase family enzyme
MEEATDIAIPILPSRDLEATARFYEALGFAVIAHWPGDEGYLILRRGGVELHFLVDRTLVPETNRALCYLRVPDVDAVHRAWALAALPAFGIPRLTAPEDLWFGMREFALVDADGTLIRVGTPRR